MGNVLMVVFLALGLASGAGALFLFKSTHYGWFWALIVTFGAMREFYALTAGSGTATSQYRIIQAIPYLAGCMIGFLFFALEHFGLEARYPNIPSWWRIVAAAIGFVVGAKWLYGRKKDGA